MTKGVFSEFEVKEQWIKVKGEESYSTMSCVGSSEEELEVKVITKKCRGVKAKEKVKGTGSGTLTESLHVPRVIYNKMYDMNRANLKKGVYAYGQSSSHPEFSITQRVQSIPTLHSGKRPEESCRERTGRSSRAGTYDHTSSG